MKLSTLLVGGLASVATAQTSSPYTDAKSGITFSYWAHTSGYFFGIALPANTTGNTDFIATLGGKGTGWSGVSLGGEMTNKLLLLAWPNGQNILGSFRKTGQHSSPAVATGTFTQTPIANGTYVNSTHWTYTFLCSKCILSDKTTFDVADTSASIGYALSAAAPSQKTNAGSAVSKHTAEGKVTYDLKKAQNQNFATWKTWATPATKVGRSFEG